MPNPLTVRRLLALALCLCAGCAVSPGAKKSSAALASRTSAKPDDQTSGASASPPAAVSGAKPQAAASNSGANDSRKNGEANGATASAPDPRVLDDVLAQLAELGPVEPEARKRLAEDLRKTDPSYWPMLVKTFRASLEYRRRGSQRAAEAAQSPHTNLLSEGAVVSDAQAEAENSGVGRPSRPPAVKDGLEGRPTSTPAPTANAYASPILPASGSAASEQAGGTPTPQASAVTAGGTPTPQASAVTAGGTPVPQASAVTAGGTPAPQASAVRAGGTPTPQASAVRAGGTPTPQADWRRHLNAAIAELERQTRAHPGEADAWTKQVYLRLLDLAAGRRDDALKPISGLPPPQQDYWARQIFALSTYLDQGSPDPGRRAAEAGLHLARAMAALGEQAPLVVHNLAFCTDVHSYGVLKRFEPATFHAGQPVLLYAEIENFKSEETAQGFHTSLEASYQIHDRQGQRVAHDELSLTEEHCQNRRRDFFVRYFITLPKNIYEGDYTLDLTIEDKLGRKINQAPIDFSVKAKK